MGGEGRLDGGLQGGGGGLNQLRQETGQRGAGNRDAAIQEQQAQFFQPAGYAHPRGGGEDAEASDHVAEFAPFKVAEQDGIALGGGERGERTVYVGGGFAQVEAGTGVGLSRLVFHGFGLPFDPAGLAAFEIAAGESGRLVEPAGKNNFAGQGRGFGRQGAKYDLRHVLGGGLAAQLREGDGIDKIQVPLDDGAEGVIGTGLHELSQLVEVKFGGGCHVA